MEECNCRITEYIEGIRDPLNGPIEGTLSIKANAFLFSHFSSSQHLVNELIPFRNIYKTAKSYKKRSLVDMMVFREETTYFLRIEFPSKALQEYFMVYLLRATKSLSEVRQSDSSHQGDMESLIKFTFFRLEEYGKIPEVFPDQVIKTVKNGEHQYQGYLNVDTKRVQVTDGKTTILWECPLEDIEQMYSLETYPQEVILIIDDREKWNNFYALLHFSTGNKATSFCESLETHGCAKLVKYGPERSQKESSFQVVKETVSKKKLVEDQRFIDLKDGKAWIYVGHEKES